MLDVSFLPFRFIKEVIRERGIFSRKNGNLKGCINKILKDVRPMAFIALRTIDIKKRYIRLRKEQYTTIK